MRFIAFDLETTGIVAGLDSIVEIGAVRFEDGQVDGIFSTLIDPRRPIPPGASAVNGISNEMVQGKPFIEDILAPFVEFCGDDYLVAHNASFDAQFLIADFKKHLEPAPSGLILDTLPISRKVIPQLPNYKLGTLVQHFKIPTTDFHRAEEDATYCGKLFLELIKRISVQGKPPAIENLVALTGKPEFRFPVIKKVARQMDLFA